MKKQAAFLFIPLLFAFNMFGYTRHHDYRFPNFSFSPSSNYQSQSSDREGDFAQNNDDQSLSDATDTNASDADTDVSREGNDVNADTNTQTSMPATPGVPNTGVDATS